MALMDGYRAIARIVAPTASLELRDNQVSRNDALAATSANYVIGAALTAIPDPSEGRYEVGSRERFSKIGRIVFVPANVPWQVRTGGGRFRTITAEFAPERFHAVTGLSGGWSERELRSFHDIHSPRLQEVLQHMYQEAVAPGFASELLTDSIAISLLVELARHVRSTDEDRSYAGRLEGWQMRRVTDLLFAAPAQATTVAALAKACEMSERTFVRRFKATTGQGIGSYVRDSKIARARQFLLDGKRGIKEIAYETGFSDASSFSFAFRRATGLTPKQFRRSAGMREA
ncbi:AraC family transcriptional regulator [Flavisphingomonas formosensis]|uniref:AraC family transcriptional regulator n=1 Tax=Flavisphingomonas formosensis TaxID=861534 RepID=UPI0012FA56A4|nr:AraC family transcriptional regulator [Sphingomonas formosensis]